MKTDKELKREFKKKASEDPDRYYATDVLKKHGYMRKQCPECGIFFWTIHEDRTVCGDPACSGGFRLFEDNPCKRALSYVDVWREFCAMFKDLGYTPIERYPVVARWNPTADFVMASIAAFQPYVISGEVEPPAKRLVIPQFSIRFSDIENIGITASHQTGFVMIGQHMFVSPEEWDQDKVFEDILKWLKEGLGLPFSEITFHEDAWAGGGNFGPCMEYFSRGVELGNQVYMMYEQQADGTTKGLDIKVLDMGMGMERNAWFSQVTPTQHQAVYPKVVDYLLEKTDLKIDEEVMKKFIPLSAMLNIDEVEDIDKAWEDVAEKIGLSVSELKKKVLPLSGIFSIADHARTLLFALHDGALPSNVGGGYNLRILVRRALSFVDEYGWDIRLADVCRLHAEELEPVFPELKEGMEEVGQILDHERKKYEATKQNMKAVVDRIIDSDIGEEKLIQLYDSQGISPYMVVEEAQKRGKEIEVPSNFFGKVAERHNAPKQEHATQKEMQLDLSGIKETKALYFDDYELLEFEGEVQKIIDEYVVLDKTVFYPTSGGQLHDLGTINGIEVSDVFKQGSVIVHKLAGKPDFKEGDSVKGVVEWERRRQLAQHHTAAHIVNYAARHVLGRHINQAGAKKSQEKAHLDVTHYEVISDESLKRIEDTANDIVNKDLTIETYFMDKRDAEREYGMGIYQGGAVPGKNVRIVDVSGLDVEACGGTHLKHTGEVGPIRILKATKIQDGIVRITFTAGIAAEKVDEDTKDVLAEAASLLGVKESQVPARAEELFSLWKKARKAEKKGKPLESYELASTEEYDNDALSRAAEVLKTQPQHVPKTIRRFLDDLGKLQK
ncbi:MAG: alanine--tRNA ligase [Candidatus Woesearchaeota archaeon]